LPAVEPSNGAIRARDKVPGAIAPDAASLPHVLADEGHHAREHVAGLRQVRRGAGVALGVDADEVDVAAGLAVGGAEALRLVAARPLQLCYRAWNEHQTRDA
jgi:hypothetical protein